MTFRAYTSGIPDGPNNPSQDQPKMKINNDNIPLLIATDHYGFNDNFGGYHNKIRQPGVLGNVDPAAIAGINQTYVKLNTPDTTGGVADTQLYTRTGNGEVSQLTGHLFGATSASDGWCWAGGLLFQWGTKITAATGGTITFQDRVAGAIPFPTNCFNVQLTPVFGGGIPSSSSLLIAARYTTLDRETFQWKLNTTSGEIEGFFWFAVGN